MFQVDWKTPLDTSVQFCKDKHIHSIFDYSSTSNLLLISEQLGVLDKNDHDINVPSSTVYFRMVVSAFKVRWPMGIRLKW